MSARLSLATLLLKVIFRLAEEQNNHNSKIEAKRIMKKNYEQPVCLVLEVESQGVFCTSGTATYSSSDIEEWGDVKKIEW